MSETKTAVAQLASWCLTVALHQEFGIGAGRLERLAKVLRRIQEENVAAVLSQGTEAAARQRESWIQGKVQMDFPVPLLRAPRTRREKQLRMAGGRGCGHRLADLCRRGDPGAAVRTRSPGTAAAGRPGQLPAVQPVGL